MKFKFGNHKLPDSTLIFNMGKASDCPSRTLGLCETVNMGIRCYAEKAEIQYSNVVPQYRDKQYAYWRTTSAEIILNDILNTINRRRKDTKLFRFNESGDFWNQKDVNKLSHIAIGLKSKGITTYGYTARSDLNYKDVQFLVKGSYNDSGNNGRCIVLNKTDPVPKGYIECPGSCKTCSICSKNNKTNVAFRKH